MLLHQRWIFQLVKHFSAKCSWQNLHNHIPNSLKQLAHKIMLIIIKPKLLFSLSSLASECQRRERCEKKWVFFFHVNYESTTFSCQRQRKHLFRLFIRASYRRIRHHCHKRNLISMQFLLVITVIFFHNDVPAWHRKKRWINNQFGISCQNKQKYMTRGFSLQCT